MRLDLTAVPFYEAMGFDRKEHLVIDLAPGIQFPAVRMRQKLK